MNKNFQYSKANTLELIKKKNKSIQIPDLISLNKKNYLKKKKFFLNKIKKKFKKKIIIRSSALNEDNENTSNAGKYESIFIDQIDLNKIDKAILKILSKYINKFDQIIIQKFISQPEYSGVIFTKDIDTNSDYYQIEYDTSKRSDLVTSGINNPSMRTLSVFKNYFNLPKNFSKLIKICKYLEILFSNPRLDIEFCIKNKKIYILQCRPLIGNKRKSNIQKHQEVLVNLNKKFEKLNFKTQNIAGSKTILSNMADWNPAEMIGNKPGKLALSLYSELITNSVWSEQRYNYGYKDVRPNCLMIDMAGTPYIDVRIDLNSFLPSNLNTKISNKIVNNSLRVLRKNPALHDKLEFEIIDTCYNFSLNKKKFSYLTKNEKYKYIKSLKEITINILSKKNSILDNEIKKNKILEKKIKDIQKTKLSHIQKIFHLIYDCKKFGTLPFAGIARCAFISKSILDSLEKEKLLEAEDLNNFYLSLNTISKQINNDYIKSYENKNFSFFLKKYGHLRPSTYSISNKNYNENFKNYFPKEINSKDKIRKNEFYLANYKIKKINQYFKQKKFNIDFDYFISFAKKSIENRELSKLIFSKSIDMIFENLKVLAKEINLDYKEFENLDINLILKSFNTLNQKKLKNLIKEDIKKNKTANNFRKNIKTPDVITKIEDFYYFYEISSLENYVTNRKVLGDIVELKNINNFVNLKNKIILIENADPGYDFIFSYKIKALITKFGGKNSHMAIRCSELNLPSIIGIGEKKYRMLTKSKKIFIDCENKKFEKFL